VTDTCLKIFDGFVGRRAREGTEDQYEPDKPMEHGYMMLSFYRSEYNQVGIIFNNHGRIHPSAASLLP
jgi:hypothetical protein